MAKVMNTFIFNSFNAMNIFILSIRQVEDANEIASIAQQARETSKEAYDMAREAMNEQVDSSKQVNVLVVQVK